MLLAFSKLLCYFFFITLKNFKQSIEGSDFQLHYNERMLVHLSQESKNNISPARRGEKIIPIS